MACIWGCVHNGPYFSGHECLYATRWMNRTQHEELRIVAEQRGEKTLTIKRECFFFAKRYRNGQVQVMLPAVCKCLGGASPENIRGRANAQFVGVHTYSIAYEDGLRITSLPIVDSVSNFRIDLLHGVTPSDCPSNTISHVGNTGQRSTCLPRGSI